MKKGDDFWEGEGYVTRGIPRSSIYRVDTKKGGRPVNGFQVKARKRP